MPRRGYHMPSEPTGLSALLRLVGLAALCWLGVGGPAAAQAPGWQVQPAPPAGRDGPGPANPPALQVPPNTTIVPRSGGGARLPGGAAGPGQISLTALLTDDGQNIEQGLLWRVYRVGQGPEKPTLVGQHREANPTLRLEPGSYVINVAFGRAHLTRKIVITPEQAGQERQERFVLNAGGLRVTPVFANGEAINDRIVTYDIFSDERDQYGQKTRVVSAIKTGVIVRLNAGIYSLVGTYGDANATARADVTVEAGKLTEATLSHAAAKVTFKLVMRAGGEAMADTQWSVTTLRGEPIKDSVGALPTHILAPGSYTALARHSGQQFRRDFSVRAGDVVQVELVMP
jgi:hypothetical protein